MTLNWSFGITDALSIILLLVTESRKHGDLYGETSPSDGELIMAVERA